MLTWFIKIRLHLPKITAFTPGRPQTFIKGTFHLAIFITMEWLNCSTQIKKKGHPTRPYWTSENSQLLLSPLLFFAKATTTLIEENNYSFYPYFPILCSVNLCSLLKQQLPWKIHLCQVSSKRVEYNYFPIHNSQFSAQSTLIHCWSNSHSAIQILDNPLLSIIK